MKRQEFEDLKFESTGKKIEEDLNFFERQAFDHSAILKKNIPIAVKIKPPIEKRDEVYYKIIEAYKSEYIERRKQVKLMRNILFYSMLCILAFIILSCVILFILVVCDVIFKGSDVTALITIGISLISTIMTIPVIMTKSLFPPKEDNQIVEVLSRMLENDQNIRDNSKEDEIIK